MARLMKWVSIVLISSGVVLTIYGAVHLYTRFHCLVENQRVQIASLELKVWELRRINDLVLVLEQILIPRQIDEFEAANERIKQKKHREYERYEQPLITEKERS